MYRTAVRNPARRNPQTSISPAIRFEISGRTAANWVDLANAEGSRFNRRHVLRFWLAANGFWKTATPNKWGPKESKLWFWKELLATADEAIGTIRSGKIDPCHSVNAMIDYLRENRKSSSTIFGARSLVLRFFRYCRLNLNPDDIEESVKKIRRLRVLTTKLPSRDQVRGLLLVSPLKTKVLISTLISTGGRTGEVLNVRREDLDLHRKPAVIYFRKTKVGKARFSFLSTETVQLIKLYLEIRGEKLEYLFDSMDTKRRKNQRRLDLPLTLAAAWGRVRKSFRAMRMNERYDGLHYFFKPKMFRVLNLALLKSGGYPADWAEYLVGHSLGTQESYIPSMDTLAGEWLKLDHLFCFLHEPNAGSQPSSIPQVEPSPSSHVDSQQRDLQWSVRDRGESAGSFAVLGTSLVKPFMGLRQD